MRISKKFEIPEDWFRVTTETERNITIEGTLLKPHEWGEIWSLHGAPFEGKKISVFNVPARIKKEYRSYKNLKNEEESNWMVENCSQDELEKFITKAEVLNARAWSKDDLIAIETKKHVFQGTFYRDSFLWEVAPLPQAKNPKCRDIASLYKTIEPEAIPAAVEKDGGVAKIEGIRYNEKAERTVSAITKERLFQETQIRL